MKNKSVWGETWTKCRKWAYPAWLAYETSERFIDYAQSTHNFMDKYHDEISNYIGNTGSQIADAVATAGTFGACEAFLTIPAAVLLYKFFDEDNLTNTKLEGLSKKLL